jgi:tRNA-intron endonuclease
MELKTPEKGGYDKVLSELDAPIDVQQANAVYVGQRIIIPTQGEADSLYQDGYGRRLENRDFALTPSEALYLVEKERLTIIDEDEGRILSFQEILNRELKKDALLWTKYIIYRDIRGRGFVTKLPTEQSTIFLVYERGTYAKKSPCYEIHTVYEGMNETIGHLEQVLQSSMRSNRTLKLAVIDRRGEVVYYSLEKAELEKLGSDALE